MAAVSPKKFNLTEQEIENLKEMLQIKPIPADQGVAHINFLENVDVIKPIPCPVDSENDEEDLEVPDDVLVLPEFKVVEPTFKIKAMKL
mmetsp:Transcript_14036/g.12014  ORF Transcript_14036/g.12014 Transcript_14036/m.12014 type:complete len:89 (-) Transcript_14036:317-583(-)|eukprot:CAMPEP_0114594846 /NCGR_PEP_ID=MMETSP0125-20121206/16564_1 /TAXON_ID=485358 ORGANISM="Aristerostoma sp., Strain ATCC 50986" /NCGR_SAMPLE_ID=MMETSP0125 /ASSEMBLY_ACC=CAM_ASM_000245 /LENGTH=88 /DNA_ID=CAMNT_0001795681 /DNA_START=58 /DNA_END=324 /DNA_ORIENTATION=+